MKLCATWNYTPYTPMDQIGVYPVIVSIQPKGNKVYFESVNFESCTLFYGKRGEEKKEQKAIEEKRSFFEVETDCEYEFYLRNEKGRQSKTRLVKTGEYPGVVVDYLHPDDEAYAHTGRFLASPFVLRTPQGNLLATMDVFSSGYPQNLTKVFRSQDDGETWEYVTELFPCFWSSLFVYEGKIYAISISKEYGDLLIGCSEDEGAHWTMPIVLARGSSFGNVNGFHKAPVPILETEEKIAVAVEYGCWGTKSFSAFVVSFEKGKDPLKAENWQMTDWASPASLGFEQSPCGIEGNLIQAKDGKIYDVLRYQQGKALYLELENFTSSLKFNEIVDFPFAHTKFYIQKYKDKYYAVGNEFPGRNMLALATSNDGKSWTIERRILNYSAYPATDVGLQYPSFFIENGYMYLFVRTAFNGAKTFHDTNCNCFFRVKL